MVYCIPGSDISTGDGAVSKRGENTPFGGAYIQGIGKGQTVYK